MRSSPTWTTVFPLERSKHAFFIPFSDQALPAALKIRFSCFWCLHASAWDPLFFLNSSSRAGVQVFRKQNIPLLLGASLLQEKPGCWSQSSCTRVCNYCSFVGIDSDSLGHWPLTLAPLFALLPGLPAEGSGWLTKAGRICWTHSLNIWLSFYFVLH